MNARVPYSETSIQTVYDNEKVLKASDQRDIVWFVSSACYLRRHWPECFGRVKRTFCFTGAIDVLLGAVVRGPISASPGFLFLLLQNISLDDFLSYF